jgi:hypothetical protein
MHAFLRRARHFALLLLLAAQIGLVAHRIEHYVAPAHQESGEESCAAFAPVTGAAPWAPPLVVPVFVVFFVRFWAVRETLAAGPGVRLGFRAQAPPV